MATNVTGPRIIICEERSTSPSCMPDKTSDRYDLDNKGDYFLLPPVAMPAIHL
jgi:hypothetical protein